MTLDLRSATPASREAIIAAVADAHLAIRGILEALRAAQAGAAAEAPIERLAVVEMIDTIMRRAARRLDAPARESLHDALAGLADARESLAATPDADDLLEAPDDAWTHDA
jgi:hypothetical protein